MIAKFFDVADEVTSSTLEAAGVPVGESSRLASTIRSGLDCTWSRLDYIETIEILEPGYARIVYLDVCNNNRPVSCQYGY